MVSCFSIVHERYLIGRVSHYEFEPVLATTDAVVQAVLVADNTQVQQQSPLLALYPYPYLYLYLYLYLYPKSDLITVRAHRSGRFYEVPNVALGAKVSKNSVLGYVHFTSEYRIDALISFQELQELQQNKWPLCVQVATGCVEATVNTAHNSQYPEILRIQLSLQSQNTVLASENQLMIYLNVPDSSGSGDSQDKTF